MECDSDGDTYRECYKYGTDGRQFTNLNRWLLQLIKLKILYNICVSLYLIIYKHGTDMINLDIMFRPYQLT